MYFLFSLESLITTFFKSFTSRPNRSSIVHKNGHYNFNHMSKSYRNQWLQATLLQDTPLKRRLLDSLSHTSKMDKDGSKLHNPIETHFNVLSRYHYYLFFFLYLSKIPVYWHILNLIFLSPPMEYTCKHNNLKNVCPCKEPVWNRSVFTETLHTKYDIHCDKSWIISFSQSMLYVGTLFGSLAFGFLSDKYGRLPMFSLCSVILAAFGCLVTVMPTVSTYIVFRCLEGFGLGGVIVTSYVLCVEYCSAKNREVVAALYHIPLNFSHISLAGISYFLRNCDKFQLAISVPLFAFGAMNWLVLESPKWLMDVEKINKAAKVMEKIANFNKKPNETIRTEIEIYVSMKAKAHKIKFWEIFYHKQLFLNFFLMSFVYFVCGMGYYGVSQYIGMMSGDIHVNVAISGALLIPGTIAAVFLLKILGRRPFLMGANFISGILMIIVVLVPDTQSPLARVIFVSICNCFFFMSFIIVFLYGVELFPTSVRTTALGLLSVLSRVGQIVAPFINSMSSFNSGIIFGVMAILAGIFCYPLPETKNVELPASLEDTQMWPRKKTAENRNDNVRIVE